MTTELENKEEKIEYKHYTLEEIKSDKNTVFLTFDCYELYKFIETLSKYSDEIEIRFEKDKVLIEFMDSSRIMLAKAIHKLENYSRKYERELLQDFKVELNLDDLTKILKTRKGDKKEVDLFFNPNSYEIHIVKIGGKYNSTTHKTLRILDIEVEEILMEALLNYQYHSIAKMSINDLNDILYEVGVYSDVTQITVNESEISFSESGTIGNSNIVLDKYDINEIDSINENQSAFSLAFINALKPLLTICNDNDTITFHIETDHPLKLTLSIAKFDVVIFLAPRVEEAEFEDEDW